MRDEVYGAAEKLEEARRQLHTSLAIDWLECKLLEAFATELDGNFAQRVKRYRDRLTAVQVKVDDWDERVVPLCERLYALPSHPKDAGLFRLEELKRLLASETTRHGLEQQALDRHEIERAILYGCAQTVDPREMSLMQR